MTPLLPSLILAVALFGRIAQAANAEDAAPTSAPATDHAVFQLKISGGFGSFQPPTPKLTLFESGRIVFWDDSLVFREGHVAPDAQSQLLQSAQALYDLDDRYSLCACLDVGTIFLSVDGPRGRKTVQALGLGTSFGPTTGDLARVSSQLMQVYQQALAVLPANAPAAQPDEVVVSDFLSNEAMARFSMGSQDATLDLRPWPSTLTGHLTGAQAQEALALRGQETQPIDWRWTDGTIHTVWVMPVLPLLAEPTDLLTTDVPLRHPAATAFNLPGHPYRVEGVSMSDVADWYRTTMPTAGWRLARDDGQERQVWAKVGFPTSSIVELHFRADSFVIDVTHVYTGVLPLPKNGGSSMGPGCTEPSVLSCISVADRSPEELRAWLSEYLGYLGWHEESPGTFWRVRNPQPTAVYSNGTYGGTYGSAYGGGTPPPPPATPLTPQIEHEGFRLEVVAADRGATAIARRAVVAPDGGWPPPSDADRWPLCDATRGTTVTIGANDVGLPQTLCVTLDTPDRLRIQVAYGHSYVDLNPQTGDYRGMAMAPSDGGAPAQDIYQLTRLPRPPTFRP